MKLIIINGPCGIGKSTVAAKLHADMPLSFLLDIDAQRRFMSHYREQPKESREISLVISNAILKTCLEKQCDVIIDKMIFDSAVLDSFHKIAKAHDADVYEIILWAPKEVVMKRADQRGWREGGLLTPEKCEMFWEKINELKEHRPHAHVLNIENKNEDDVYTHVTKIVGNENPTVK